MQNFEPENVSHPLPDSEIIAEPDKSLIKPTPDNPPWNSWIALAVWFFSVALIVVLPSLAIGFYMVKNGVQLGDAQQFETFIKSDINATILSVAAIIPAHILTLALSWLVITRGNQFSFFETLGWKFDKFRIWHIFAITAVILGLAYSLVWYFGEQENEMMRLLNSSKIAVYLVAFMATFTAPLVEEVIYRGFLYSAFQRTMGVTAAVVLVTFLFAIVHVPQYYPDFVSISLICLLSLILTLVRARTGNLLPCIALHFVFNGIQSLLLVLQSVFVNKQ